MEKIPIRKIKNALKESDPSEGFNIRSVKNVLSGKDLDHSLHRHDFFFFLAIEKGKGKHIIDFTTFPIINNSVFFIRPGQVHQLALKKGSTGYLMAFNPHFYTPRDKSAQQILRKVSGKVYCQFQSAAFKKLFSVLTLILDEYTNKREKYIDVIKANLEILFIELVRQSQNPRRSKDPDNYAQQRLEEFLELLETHSSTHKQVADYAGMLNLTPYQLNSIIGKTLGKTCSQVIDEHVVLECKRHLLGTSSQVNQIAYQLGFEDVSYFIRFFKKKTGYTPEAFRRNST